jgi:hypothetical protein
MSSRSTTLQPSITYDITRVLPYVTEKLAGDGYFGSGDGNHTAQFSLDSFTGKFHVEASIANNPTDADWITIKLAEPTVSTTQLTVLASGAVSQSGNLVSDIEYTAPETSNKVYNFIGNFTWIRVVVENWSTGTINSILLNH